MEVQNLKQFFFSQAEERNPLKVFLNVVRFRVQLYSELPAPTWTVDKQSGTKEKAVLTFS